MNRTARGALQILAVSLWVVLISGILPAVYWAADGACSYQPDIRPEASRWLEIGRRPESGLVEPQAARCYRLNEQRPLGFYQIEPRLASKAPA